MTHHPEYFSLTFVGSLVSIIPLAVAFLLLQRYWRDDLASEAIK